MMSESMEEQRQNTGESLHRRRAHYGGKYPRHFEEKYKELQPDKYRDLAEHVKSKGNTPAGTHIPIMVAEVLEQLRIQPGENGLDCTFGYGGHSSKMLEQLQGKGHLTSLDVDPIESARSEARLRALGYGEGLFAVEHINFAEIDRAAAKYGPFDFVLADLGISSMQLDNPERGFSYKADGPLDLRMNPTAGRSAAELLADIGEEELAGLFLENSDEPYGEQIAHAVIQSRKKGRKLQTTLQFRDLIEATLASCGIPQSEFRDTVKKSCARCFQALRIDVNGEFEALDSLLRKLPAAVKPGGRIVFLTFHSGEDRLVKLAFKEGFREGIYSDIARDVIRPSGAECTDNPRAKSTKLRFAVRA